MNGLILAISIAAPIIGCIIMLFLFNRETKLKDSDHAIEAKFCKLLLKGDVK